MDNFEDLMRTNDPAAAVEPLDAARRTTLLDRATKPDTPSRKWRWASVAAAVALAGGLIGWQALTPGAAEAHADEVLQLAAVNAVDPDLQPGQWWRIESTATSVSEACDDRGCRPAWRSTSTSIDYVDPSGTNATVSVRDVDFSRVPLTDPPIEEREPGKTGEPEPTGYIVTATQGSWSSPTVEWVAALPRDPDALRHMLTAGAEDDADAVAFRNAVDLLDSGMAPADLRRAIFTVMERLAHVEVTRPDVDVDGHSGVEIAQRDKSGAVETIVLDPATGQVVGALEDFSGELVFESTVTRTVVDEVPAEHQTLAEACELDDDGMTVCNP